MPTTRNGEKRATSAKSNKEGRKTLTEKQSKMDIFIKTKETDIPAVEDKEEEAATADAAGVVIQGTLNTGNLEGTNMKDMQLLLAKS